MESVYEAPKFEQVVETKTKEILKNSSETKKVVRRASRQIVLDRTSKRFYEDLYARRYPHKELKKRPFLNIGPGSFRHKHWRLADKTYGAGKKTWTEMRRGVAAPRVDHSWDLYERSPVDIADNHIEAVYSSHVIEHLFAEDLDFMLSEVHRVLKPGGVVRLVCPDASLLADAYDREDWEYFLFYLIVMTNRSKKHLNQYTEPELRKVCAVFLLDWVSLMVHPKMENRLSPNKCVDFIASHKTTYQAMEAASRQSPRTLNSEVGAHVSWYSYEKLARHLELIGFKSIRRSGYLQSRMPVMRDKAYFDRTDCEMSLYVEAEK